MYEKSELEYYLQYCEYNNKIINLVLESDKKLIFIILDRSYDSNNPNYLIGEDYDLFARLYHKIPNKIMKLCDYNVSRAQREIKDIHFGLDYYLNTSNKKNCLLICQNGCTEFDPEKYITTIEKREWNDSFHEYKCEYYYDITYIFIIRL